MDEEGVDDGEEVEVGGGGMARGMVEISRSWDNGRGGGLTLGSYFT